MLLENQQKDSMSKDIFDLPFPNPAAEITSSPHNDVLTRILYMASGSSGLKNGSDGSDAFEADTGGGCASGKYVTCSKV